MLLFEFAEPLQQNAFFRKIRTCRSKAVNLVVATIGKSFLQNGNASVQMGPEQLNVLAGRVFFIAAMVALYTQLFIGLPFLPFFVSSFCLIPWIRGENPTLTVLLRTLPFMVLAMTAVAIRVPEEFMQQGRSWVLLLLSLVTSTILLFGLGRLSAIVLRIGFGG